MKFYSYYRTKYIYTLNIFTFYFFNYLSIISEIFYVITRPKKNPLRL